jgi:predicted ATPase
MRHNSDCKILATSRMPLGVMGEAILEVTPLRLPPELVQSSNSYDLEALAEIEAVRLFVDRATAIAPRFHLSAQNAEAVAHICWHLDGIPLAVELAAARVRLMAPKQIANRLTDRFRMLTGGEVGRPPRHQTLEATIDWSHDLLSLPERVLFRRLSVFAGGWSMESAEAICSVNPEGDCLVGNETLDAEQVWGLLDQLVDRSLVQVEEGTESNRYRLLETVRQYAQERLIEAGESDCILGAHRQHFMELAEEAEAALDGPDQAEWLDRLEREQGNFRAALGWSVEGESRLRMAASLWRYWYRRGPLAEGRGWLENVLGRSTRVSPALRARALTALGNLACQQGDYPAARSAHEEALALRRAGGSRMDVAGSLINLGIVAQQQGALELARVSYEESLEINRSLGNEQRIAATLVNLWVVTDISGEGASNRHLLMEAKQLYECLENHWALAIVLNNLGKVADGEGDWRSAERWFQASLRGFLDVSDRANSLLPLNGIASACCGLGDLEKAALLFLVEDAARQETGASFPLVEQERRERERISVCQSLGEEKWKVIVDRATTTSLDQAVVLALEGRN